MARRAGLEPAVRARRAAASADAAPLLDPQELAAFGAGRARRAQRLLGAHLVERDGVAGARFAVWAPNAAGVAVRETGQDLERLSQDTHRDYWMGADEAKEYRLISTIVARVTDLPR